VSVSLPVDGPGDAELISAVRGGDVEAYGELFARHVESARRLARQLAGSGDADDLVSDAFTKVLTVLQRGGGPDLAFRAYLLTAVRRLHVDRVRAGSRLRPVDDLTPFDPGLPFQDTAVEGFENAAAAKAFASLPERWQMVLWHTEVEQQKPADIAPLLGMSANSVSALAYRAREGLRQAFLSQHATDPDDVDCAWTRDHLGAYVRSGLSRRDATRVDEHLASCRACAAVYLELTEVNSGLAGIIAPLLLGTAGAAYFASSGGGAAGGAAGGGAAGAASGASGGSGMLSTTLTAAKAFVVAHASLTAIGGLAVAASVVAGSVYGVSHLRSHDAADLGSPPALSHGAQATNGPVTNGPGTNAPGTNAPGTNTQPGQSPATGTSGAPGTDPSSLPTGTPTGPTDSPTGAPTGGPTTAPTGGPTGPTDGPTGPTGGGPVKITSTPPTDPSFGDTYRLQASGGSGQQIVFSIGTDTTHQACSLNAAGDVVTFDHAGRCVVRADEPSKHASANGAARSSSDNVQRIHVPREDQKIDFSSAPDNAVVGGQAYRIDATGGQSGNEVVLTTTTPDVCTVSGTDASFQHVGKCGIAARQAGDHDYRDATETQTFGVSQGTPSLVLAGLPSDPAFHTSYDATQVTASVPADQGKITLVVDATTNDACRLGNDETSVIFEHAGSCTFHAHITETSDYTAVDSSSQTVTVPPQLAPTFTFNDLPQTPQFNDQYDASQITSDSDGNVTLVLENATNACTLAQDGTHLTFNHAGTCTFHAHITQAGDYTAADSSPQTVTVPPQLTPTFTFNNLPTTAVLHDHYDASQVTSNSKGTITFVLDNPSNNACTLNDDHTSVRFQQHAGTCTFHAQITQAGDYTAADSSPQTVTVPPQLTPTFTFNNLPTSAAPGDHYDVSEVTSKSTGTITFVLDNSTSACTLAQDGTSLTFNNGTCTFHAHITQAGDYTAADSSPQTVTVADAALQLDVTSQPAWLGFLATQVTVQVKNLNPGAHATLSMSTDNAYMWLDPACTGSHVDATCQVGATTTFVFDGVATGPHATATFTISSDDGQATYTSPPIPITTLQ
jgi:RNA polymerase sigma factor (sigma-70 family)